MYENDAKITGSMRGAQAMKQRQSMEMGLNIGQEAATPRRGELGTQVEHMGDNISQLGMAIEALEHALSPVTLSKAPATVAGSEAIPQPPCTEAAATLYEFNLRINRLQRLVTDMHHRLEL